MKEITDRDFELLYNDAELFETLHSFGDEYCTIRIIKVPCGYLAENDSILGDTRSLAQSFVKYPQ